MRSWMGDAGGHRLHEFTGESRRACFGSPIRGIVWRRQPISASTIDVEDVAAISLALHHLQGSLCAQQRAQQVGLHNRLQLLWRALQ